MKGHNSVTLIGNLGQDPVLTQVGSSQVVNCSIACTESRKNSAGEWVDHTEWVKLAIWGKMAGVVAQLCRKGSRVFVRGALRTRKWEKDGQTHYSTEVNVDNIILLDGKNQSSYEEPATGGGMPDDRDDELPF
jgi:single-strand DNA-binding protein